MGSGDGDKLRPARERAAGKDEHPVSDDHFRCYLAGGAPHTSDETARLRWMTPDEVRAEMDEAYAIRMLDAFEGGPPAIRSHDGRGLLPA